MRSLLAAALLLVSFAASSQTLPTCPVAPADPVPRDQIRLTWTRPVQNTDGSAIPSTTTLTYTVYERVGTVDTARCTTNGTLAGQTGLSAGVHTWVVTARVGTGPESAPSGAASKTIQPPPTPTPNPPTNLTIASTRIESSDWTCRDSAGVVLSEHTRQDKAFESCANLALASVGTNFEIRPSGYRIRAQF